MPLLIVATVNAIAALLAHAIAGRKGRNADGWTFATALFFPALLVLLVLPQKPAVEEEADDLALEGGA